jgi:hypothetical protein
MRMPGQLQVRCQPGYHSCAAISRNQARQRSSCEVSGPRRGRICFVPMPSTDAERFRRIALALEGAWEGTHMGHPDFRIDKRIFASLHPGNECGMVKLTPDQQAAFIEDHPKAFSPEAGAWGRSGCTRVVLASIDENILGDALTLAWRNTRKVQRKKCR